MPLPLALPLLLKGGLIAVKYMSAKGAAATVIKAVAVSTKVYGLGATVSAVATGLVVVGGVAWTCERYLMAQSAVKYFDDGDYIGAANEVTRIIKSVYMDGVEDVAGIGQEWLNSGASIDSPLFKQLVGVCRQAVDELNITNNQLKRC